MKSFFKAIFLLTLLYYAAWIVFALVSMITGIDSGWAMPAMSNGEKDYGVDAFFSAFGLGVFVTVMRFWFIPLYDVIYLIGSGIAKLVSLAKK